jgi:hypothetical protein
VLLNPNGSVVSLGKDEVVSCPHASSFRLSESGDYRSRTLVDHCFNDFHFEQLCSRLVSHFHEATAETGWCFNFIC